MKLFKRRKEDGEALFATEEEPEKDAAEIPADTGDATSMPASDKDAEPKAPEPKAPEPAKEEGAPEPKDEETPPAPRDRNGDEGFFDLEADEVADYRPAGGIVAARKPLNLVPAIKILILIAVVGGLITALVFIWPSSMARVPSLVGQPLTDAMETGRAKGKVVLTMKLAQLAPLRLGDAAVWRPGVLIDSRKLRSNQKLPYSPRGARAWRTRRLILEVRGCVRLALRSPA